MRKCVARVCIYFSAAGGVLAVAWWLIFFHQLLGSNVKVASKCFYQTYIECEVGNIFEWFTGIPYYRPELLWISIGIFLFGMLLLSFPSD